MQTVKEQVSTFVTKQNCLDVNEYQNTPHQTLNDIASMAKDIDSGKVGWDNKDWDADWQNRRT